MNGRQALACPWPPRPRPTHLPREEPAAVQRTAAAQQHHARPVACQRVGARRAGRRCLEDAADVGRVDAVELRMATGGQGRARQG